MKVLFSNMPWWEGQDEQGVWTAGVRAGSRWPFRLKVQAAPDRFVPGEYLPYPFFLGFAASYCRQALPDAEVSFRDSIALRESYQSINDYLTALLPDYLVLESATPSWDHDSRFINWLRERFPTRVIVTGSIATARGAEILRDHPNVIAVVKGEYEKGVVRVLKGERGIIDHDLLTTEEMNAAPSPWLDDLHAHRYYDANPKAIVSGVLVNPPWPHLQVWGSRGCPFKCIFCVWPASMTGNDPDGNSKRTARFYSPEWLQQFIGGAVAQYGYRSVYLDDDTANLSDRHTLNVCGVMREVGLPWSAMCRADTVSPQTWREMRNSGCFGVKIGFESGSQYVLDHIVNKRLDLGKAVDTLRLLKDLGIAVHTTWTVGLPGETPAQVQETVDLIRRLYDEGLHATHQLSGTATVEGTPLATLATCGSLPKYDGARADGFDFGESDGMVKLNRLARRPS